MSWLSCKVFVNPRMPTQLLQLLVLLELFQNPPMTWKTLGISWASTSGFNNGGDPYFEDVQFRKCYIKKKVNVELIQKT